MPSERGLFKQGGYGFYGAVNPLVREQELPPPQSAAESAARMIGELAGYGAVAYLGAQTMGGSLVARFGPAAGRLLAEGGALTIRDIANDIVEEDLNAGTVTRQVALNFAVPLSLNKIVSRAASRGGPKLTRMKGPTDIFTGKGTGLTPDMMPEETLFTRGKRKLVEAPGLPKDVYQPEWEIFALSAGDATEFRKLMESYGSGKLKLKGAQKTLVDELRSSSGQLLRLFPEGTSVADLKDGQMYAVFLNENLKEIRRRSLSDAGKATWEMNGLLKGLSKQERLTLPHVIEGTVEPANSSIAAAAEKFKEIRSQIADTIEKEGIKIRDHLTGKELLFENIRNYYPNYVDIERLERITHGVTQQGNPELWALRQKLESWAVSDFQKAGRMGITGPEAIKLKVMEQQHRQVSSLMVRHGFEFFNADPVETLPRYFEDIYRSIEEYKGLLKPVTIGDQTWPSMRAYLMEKIASHGGDNLKADDIVNRFLGTKIYAPGRVAVSNMLRTAQLVDKMGLSPITNVGGFTNTATLFGLKSTWQGLTDAFFAKNDKIAGFAARAGAVSHDLATLLASERTPTGTKILQKFGFTRVERFLREHAALTARRWVINTLDEVKAGKEVDAASRRLLGKLQISEKAARTGTASEDDLLRAGFRGSEMTQFLGDVLNNPAFASSPEGKILFQMRTFVYQQAGFVKREIYDEAKQGNLKPLARMLMFGSALGEGINSIKDLARLKNPGERSLFGAESLGGVNIGDSIRDGLKIPFPRSADFVANRFLDNILLLGYLGSWLDITQGTFASGYGGLLGLVGGPTGSSLQDISGALGGLASGNPQKAAELGTRIALTGAAMVGVPGSARMIQALPALRTLSGESEGAKLRGLATPPEEKIKAIMGKARTQVNSAKERITGALRRGSVGDAMSLLREYNNDVRDRYLEEISKVGSVSSTMRKELTIDLDELLNLKKKVSVESRRRVDILPKMFRSK